MFVVNIINMERIQLVRSAQLEEWHQWALHFALILPMFYFYT